MNIEQSESRSITALCSLLGFSRQAYYQHLQQSEKEALEQELLIQEVLLIRKDQKRLGARKLLHKMQDFIQQHHIGIGRDSFFDLLAENGLLVRRRVARTTFSNHWLRKYPHLVVDFIPVMPNQLWVSDITYIVLENGFAYLSLITDAYSRKIVGYYLSKNLTAKGCIEALKTALQNNPERNNLIHHSDRGSQYCCGDYVKLLEKNNIGISMTQSGDPLENALAERVNGILKDELLDEEYNGFGRAQQAVSIAINIYNHQRPHYSIDLLTPEEAHQKAGELKKRWKNYYQIQKRKEVEQIILV